MTSLISLIIRLFKGRDLRATLNATRSVRVCGVKFVIRKISPLDYLDGSQVMLQYYDEYKKQKETGSAVPESTIKRMRSHYADVFVNAVVYPKIVRKQEDDKGDAEIYVEHLFTDMSLANDLYIEIMAYANGKKKIQILVR